MLLTPKNWTRFQHYKDRNPPWIKLHKDLLDDRIFQRLPVASRALAPMLWLLASESSDGKFDGSVEELAFRLRATEKEIQAGLQPLIHSGFFLMVQDASSVLADCQRGATPETEGEAETETEKEAEGSAAPKIDAPPAVTLTLVTGAEHPVSPQQVDEWVAAYPAVNVMQQLREMKAWCNANPANRKTARGINAFIVRWLAKEQDKGCSPYRPAEIATKTVPGPAGRDPALKKLDEDAKRAAPMPADIRAKLNAVLQTRVLQ